MATHTVTAALVVAHVSGRVQHFYHGDVLPPNVDEESLENLKSLGFVEEQKSDDPDTTWTVPDLKAFAVEHEIDLGDATKKADILAALAAAKA